MNKTNKFFITATLLDSSFYHYTIRINSQYSPSKIDDIIREKMIQKHGISLTNYDYFTEQMTEKL